MQRPRRGQRDLPGTRDHRLPRRQDIFLREPEGFGRKSDRIGQGGRSRILAPTERKLVPAGDVDGSHHLYVYPITGLVFIAFLGGFTGHRIGVFFFVHACIIRFFFLMFSVWRNRVGDYSAVFFLMSCLPMVSLCEKKGHGIYPLPSSQSPLYISPG